MNAYLLLFILSFKSWMSCNFLNSSWMQDEDIHYADALFPLIHTRVNDSFVSVSAPDDRAAVLHAETAGSTDAVWTLTRRCRGRGYCWELHTSISIDWILSSIILSCRYNCLHQCALVCFLPSQMDVDGNRSPGLAYQLSALLQMSERLAANTSYNHFCCAVQYTQPSHQPET